MTANVYRVPVKAWRRWSARARRLFNELYGTMKTNPEAFQASKAQVLKLGARSWRVTCWNAAWIAADACDGR